MANQISSTYDGSRSANSAPQEKPANLQPIGYPAGILLHTQWQWDNPKVDLTRRTKGMMDNLVDQVMALKDKYDALLRTGQLTTAGVRDQVAASVRKDFVPVWKYIDKEAWLGIQAMIADLRGQMVPKTEKADVAGAVLRSDLRRMWGAMASEVRMGLLYNPTRDLTAALLEVPGAMVGLKPADAEALLERLGETQFPQQMAAIEELQDVRVFLGSIMVFVQSDVMAMLKQDAADFEKLVWGDTLPWNTKSFQLNTTGTGPKVTPVPGDLSGVSTDMIYR